MVCHTATHQDKPIDTYLWLRYYNLQTTYIKVPTDSNFHLAKCGLVTFVKHLVGTILETLDQQQIFKGLWKSMIKKFQLWKISRIHEERREGGKGQNWNITKKEKAK